jgi:GntR family transcriptional regulator
MTKLGYTTTTELQQVLSDASADSRRRGHAFIGTEHLLVALIRAPYGTVARLLHGAGADAQQILGWVEAHMAADERRPAGRSSPYTTRAKGALAVAGDEASVMQETQVGAEHLLLGLATDGRSIAGQALHAQGMRVIALRAAIARETGTQMPELHVVIDEASDRTIGEQIVTQIQEQIATGRLGPGDRLPTIRWLADTLDVAPGTVGRAYTELEALGCVISDGARGTVVAATRDTTPPAERPAALARLLRPVVVAAFHLGATAAELRAALTVAMRGIFREA